MAICHLTAKIGSRGDRRGILYPQRQWRLERIGFTFSFFEAARYDWESCFAKLQRSLHRAGRLPPERVRALEALGFEWELLEALWEERLEAWRAHVRKTGSAHIPQRFPENPSLARWVTEQRLGFHKGELARSRVVQLTRGGFLWSVHDAKWEERFSELQAFQRRNGHAPVPQGWPRNPALAHCLHWQLQSGRRGTLSAERKRRLADLGILRPLPRRRFRKT